MFTRNTNRQAANEKIAELVSQARALITQCEQIAAANGLVFQMNNLMSDDAVTEQPDWNDSGCVPEVDESDWTSSDEEEWQDSGWESSSFC